MLYNPLKEKITRTIRVPLYYTGLTKTAKIAEKANAIKEYKLNRDYSILLYFIRFLLHTNAG